MVYDFEKTKSFQYISEREFDPHELLLYFHACGFEYSHDLKNIYYCTTLGINKDNPSDCVPLYLIDKEGFFQRALA